MHPSYILWWDSLVLHFLWSCVKVKKNNFLYASHSTAGLVPHRSAMPHSDTRQRCLITFLSASNRKMLKDSPRPFWLWGKGKVWIARKKVVGCLKGQVKHTMPLCIHTHTHLRADSQKHSEAFATVKYQRLHTRLIHNTLVKGASQTKWHLFLLWHSLSTFKWGFMFFFIIMEKKPPRIYVYLFLILRDRCCLQSHPNAIGPLGTKYNHLILEHYYAYGNIIIIIIIVI